MVKKDMGLAIYIFFDNRIKSWNGNKEIMSEIEVINILQQPHPLPTDNVFEDFEKLAFFYFACQDCLDKSAPTPYSTFINDARCLIKKISLHAFFLISSVLLSSFLIYEDFSRRKGV